MLIVYYNREKITTMKPQGFPLAIYRELFETGCLNYILGDFRSALIRLKYVQLPTSDISMESQLPDLNGSPALYEGAALPDELSWQSISRISENRRGVKSVAGPQHENRI